MNSTVGANQSLSLLQEPNLPTTDSRLLAEVTILSYVSIGTLGAIIWDIVSNIGADYRLLTSFAISIPTVVYVVSRISVLIFFTVSAIIYTRETDSHCVETLNVAGWILTVAVPATTLLFFLRVRALYRDNYYVVGFFFLLWLGIVAGCIVATGGHLPHSHDSQSLCLNGNLDFAFLINASSVVPTVNDILVFCAITWRLMQTAHLDPKAGFKRKMRVMVFGDYLPAFSRTLLRDGQAYLLATAILGVVTVATFYSGAPYSMSLSYPNIAIMHMMGCRIYRKTKLRAHKLSGLSDPPLSRPMAFHPGPASDTETI